MRRIGASVRVVVIVALIVSALAVVVGPSGPAAADRNEAPAANTAFSQITAGAGHACAFTLAGALKCWGFNAGTGAIGLGEVANRGDAPGEMGDDLPSPDLGTGRTAVSVSAGSFHTCAVLDNAQLKCWGFNTRGQLGQGNTTTVGDNPGEMGDALAPVNLGTGRTAVAVSGGTAYTCAVLDNGSVKCWGNNAEGQLGLGDNAHRGDGPNEMGDNLPAVNLGTGRTAVAVSTGDKHTCAILDNGTVKCWGQADFLGLGVSGTNIGDGPNEMGDNLPAVNLGSGRTATAIAVGGTSACAVLDNGSVKCWGGNLSGQLGLGDTITRGDDAGEMGDSLPAVSLGTGRTAVGISTASGNGQTCALLDNSSVKCWGLNNVGQLGQGDTSNRGDGPNEMGDNLPAVDLGTGRSALAVTVGAGLSCARLDDGGVKCWGTNGSGSLGLGDTVQRGDGPNEMGDNLGEAPLVTPAPAMTVVLTADESSVAVGATIHTHATITNTGNVGLTGLTVPTAGCSTPAAVILPGADTVVNCTHVATVDDLSTYAASASADSDQTTAVTSNTVNVTVTIPSGSGLLKGTVRQTVFPNNAASDVFVAVLDKDTFSLVGMDVSAGDGTYATLVPAGQVFLYLADTAGNYVPTFASLSPTTVGDGATVTVDPQVQKATGGIESRAVDSVNTNDGIATALAMTVNLRTGQIDGGAASDQFGYWVIRNLRSEAHLAVTFDLSGGHVPEYYDGSPSPGGATPINLVGGALQVLPPATMVAQSPPDGNSTVQGVVTGPGGAPAPGIAVVVLNAGSYSFEAGGVTNGSGVYSVPVDPGSYVVGFADANATPNLVFEWNTDQPANALASATPVFAPADNLVNVNASLGAMRGSVAGTVTEDGSGDPLQGIWAFAIDSTGSVVGVAKTAANGTYTVANVPAGPVRVRFFDLTSAHVAEYYDDHGGASGSDGYALADVVAVTGGATATVDASLASTLVGPPPD